MQLCNETFEEEIANILRGLRLKRLVDLFDNISAGLSFRQKGRGCDFHSLREYSPGQDDYRQIDWKSMAKYQKPYVKEYQSEPKLEPWLIVDSSASMLQKEKRLQELLFLFIKLFTEHLKQNNWINLFWGANKVEGHSVIEPQKGISRASLNLIKSIELKGESNLPSLIRSLGSVLKKRSLIIFFTDLIGFNDWSQHLYTLSISNTVLIVSLNSSIDTDLPDLGYINFKDPESGRQALINSSNSSVRELYKNKATEKLEAIKSSLKGHCEYLNLWTINTDLDLMSSLDKCFI